MKNIWTIISQSSSIDNRTNQLSAFNLLDGITFTRPEEKRGEEEFISPVAFQLISFWICKNKDDKAEVKIRVSDPDNKMVNEFDINIHPVDDKLRVRNIVDFGAFKVTKPGVYSIALMIKDGDSFKTISEIPLDIKVEYIEIQKQSKS